MNINTQPLIIAIDDDRNHREILSELLSGKGYQVRTAGNLAEARSVLGQARPDLIILDRNLPDGDGLDLCKEIRETPGRPPVPILFLSVRNQVSEMVRGLNTGADDYLPKPFGMEELLARVMAILRRAARPPYVPSRPESKPQKKKTRKKQNP